MLEARIQQQFFETADLLYQTADILSRPVSEAALAVVGCVTSGGKLLACGLGADADLARWLCNALVLGLERPRPPLAALALSAGALAGAAAQASAAESLATQIRVLGQPGDVLVLLAGLTPEDAALRGAMAAAHEMEMSVVLLTGGEPGAWPDRLAETDVWIPVAHPRLPRVRELHLLALHALCDAIDVQLLGEAPSA